MQDATMRNVRFDAAIFAPGCCILYAAQGRNEPMTDMPARRRRPAALAACQPEEDAFDLWLGASLREAFDQVASEPIPEDLLKMIEEDRAERERLRRRRRGEG
jgi:hypothetical protein